MFNYFGLFKKVSFKGISNSTELDYILYMIDFGRFYHSLNIYSTK